MWGPAHRASALKARALRRCCHMLSSCRARSLATRLETGAAVLSHRATEVGFGALESGQPPSTSNNNCNTSSAVAAAAAVATSVAYRACFFLYLPNWLHPNRHCPYGWCDLRRFSFNCFKTARDAQLGRGFEMSLWGQPLETHITDILAP